MTALYGESSSSSVFDGPNRAYDGVAHSLRRSFNSIGLDRGPSRGSIAPACVHRSCPHTNASLSRRFAPHAWFTSARALCSRADDHTPTVKRSWIQSMKSSMCARLYTRKRPNLPSGATLVPSGATCGDIRRSTRRPLRSTTRRCLCLRWRGRCARRDARSPVVADASASVVVVGGGGGGGGGGAGFRFGILNPPREGGGRSGGSSAPGGARVAVASPSRGVVADIGVVVVVPAVDDACSPPRTAPAKRPPSLPKNAAAAGKRTSRRGRRRRTRCRSHPAGMRRRPPTTARDVLACFA